MKTLVAAAILLPATAFAGGYAVPNTNARDLSLAGSAVAAQNDATAAYVNPAALAGLEGLSVVANGTIIDFRSAWTAPGGASSNHVDMTRKGAFPPSLFASYGGKAGDTGWGVGAGFNIPFGGNVYWPAEWPGNQSILTVNRRGYAVYLTGGVQPLKQVKVGGGLVYYRTTEDLSLAENFLVQEGRAEIGTAGGKLSWQASIELTPFADVPFTLGLDYKHKADQILNGTAHFTNVPGALLPNALDQDVRHDLTIPNLFNVGAAFRVLPNLLLTAAFTLDRFIVYKRDVFAGNLGTTVIVNHDFTNGETYRAGAELTELIPHLTVRAGILRDIAPSRPSTFHPAIPDSDVTAASIGLGYAFSPDLELNGTFFHAFYDTLTTTADAAFPGTYDTRANIVTLGIVWHMGSQPRGNSAALVHPIR